MVYPYDPGNPQASSGGASSGGETRKIRSGYGDREIYPGWAAKAGVGWRDRREEFGRKLIYPSSSPCNPVASKTEMQIAICDTLKLPSEMLI
ncbi:hypothetical protein GCM10010990_13820 [Croceicoccus mobilis]|uniref:Uncharacterized protein n=2 Tax=Croceicoccus mobilis TaxID=1703339 RepID=A0A917DTH4_9SPHN|nr:hypothetical protein GCM10010990_13820 [Croceicoccus mobilis]